MLIDRNQIDRYMLHELAILSQTAEKAYDDYEFNRAMTALSNFCTTTLSSFYFEIAKDSLYNDAIGSQRRESTVYMLEQVRKARIRHIHLSDKQQILPVLLSICSPVAPHLAEDIWEHWPMQKAHPTSSVFEKPWHSAVSLSACLYTSRRDPAYRAQHGSIPRWQIA